MNTITVNYVDSAASKKLKVGTGSGEKRLWIGPKSKENEFNAFFGWVNNKCTIVILKKDLVQYLEDAQDEFNNPTQNYANNITNLYSRIVSDTNAITDEVIEVIFEPSIDSARYYITTGKGTKYDYLRNICLPLYTILSFTKTTTGGSPKIYLTPYFNKNENISEIAGEKSNEQKTLPSQTIYYGAPGTGKSYKTNEIVKSYPDTIRTTFHPDSDYASFVGCYKPVEVPKNVVTGFPEIVDYNLTEDQLADIYKDLVLRKYAGNLGVGRWLYASKYWKCFSNPYGKINATNVMVKAGETSTAGKDTINGAVNFFEDLEKNSSLYKTEISYKFTQQAFLKAYIQAWEKMSAYKQIYTPKIVSAPLAKTISPYNRTNIVGTKTSFSFTPFNGATLTSDEQSKLLEVDNFDFPFEGIDNFGDLHDKINVVVTNEPTEEQKKQKHYIIKITLTAQKIKDLYDKYQNLLQRQRQNQDLEEVLEVLSNILNKIADKLRVELAYLEDYKGDDVTIEIDSSDGGYGSAKLLGLYVHQEKTIYLFKKNIGDKIWLLCAVYIHEMFHAYYDSCDQYVPEIEEPIVECNTLCFLELFDKKFMDAYLTSVKNKRCSLAISHYGFGSYLFDNRSLDWMKLYKDVWGKIDKDSNLVKNYVDEFFPIYPFGDEANTMDLLYSILNPQSSTKEIPCSVRQYLVIEEINRGNCAQIFGDIFQLLDRNDYGFSTYPIVPDADITRELKEVFKDLDLSAVKDYINGIFSENYQDGIVDKIKSGELLVLPNNLYILATMNTSDQSLFPMDSAFKRRWEWEYVPITNAYKKKENGEIEKDSSDNPIPLGWKIKLDDKHELIGWWAFLQRINEVVAELTTSEDKQLGYFFTKPDKKENENDAENTIISAERFVSKVIFYLWNDVFKDYGYEPKCCKDKEEKKDVLYAKFYKDDKSIDLEVLKNFFEKLKKEQEKSLIVEKGTSVDNAGL